jgi:hypothetical protein
MKILEIVDLIEGKYSGPMEPLSAKGTAKDGAVTALETALIRAKKNGTEMNYENIDAMMQRICRSHNITGQKLHDDFVKAHNLIPDNWIKKQKLKENTGLNYNGQSYMDTPRIQSLIQQAQEIESQLAPVESGHTRLWRGNRPGEVGQNPTFTNSLVGIALPFLQQYGGSLTYIDVPTQDLAQYTDSVASAPNSEFTVTPELAQQAQVVKENFADGRHPGRKGLAKRSGVNTKASVSSLRNTAKHSSGEKQRMAHWLANMKAGKAKAKKK